MRFYGIKKLVSHLVVESHSSRVSMVLCLIGATKFHIVLRAIRDATLDDLASVPRHDNTKLKLFLKNMIYMSKNHMCFVVQVKWH